MTTNLPDLHVEYRRVETLRPASRNARTHRAKQIQQLAASIQTFGFTNPLLIDANGQVVAGHGRLAAAKTLGLDEVPTIQLAHLTPAQRRAYVIADNKLAELAGWDHDLLTLELHELHALELEFELTVTGFELGELDIFLDTAPESTGDPEEADVPAINEDVPPISVLGDCWELGPHRLLCGDATCEEDVKTLMGADRAQMVFLDPPYNVPIEGHVSGLGQTHHPNFAMAAGELSDTEFTTWLERIFSHLVTHSQDGAIHYICMDWRHLYDVLTAVRTVYTELKNVCVWKKTNGGMGSFYRSQHELVLVAKQGRAPHINNFGLGQYGRYRTNVWDYPGNNAFHDGRLEALAMHPTVKPVALIADALKDCSHRGGIVLDSCAGSGTTLIAAEQTGRIGYLMELDPRYVDTIIRRWHAYTGQTAHHAQTGEPFPDCHEGLNHGQ